MLVPVGVDVVDPHEVMHDQLWPAAEQVEEAHRAVRALERVRLVDPDHRQPAPRRTDLVPLPGQFLLPGQQLLARGEPLLARNHLGQVADRHHAPSD
jgi:hypothetical protein